MTPHTHALKLGTAVILVMSIWMAHDADALSETEVVELFSQSKELFRQANEVVAEDPGAARELYRKSVMRLERIVSEGNVHNGRLFYNIGNAYFRMEDIGRAILNYRRAETLIPHDQNLQRNLRTARMKRLDRVETKQETKILHTLFFWHYDVSTETRSRAFAVCFLFAWLLAGARLFRKRSSLNWCLSGAALLATLLLASLMCELVVDRQTRSGVVVAREVIARKGDSDTYEKSFTDPLHAGTELALLEDRREWYHVELADGRRCWLPTEAVKLVE
ncbi:MAG: hypothetical protein HN742_15255 [Lentisphaerae bacterium]|jgi:hypothetical protein|nr:hypothetical protein [Lentisphaerota bacterium]MBT4817572.1 hypothetical protein [Lentisphaerota bacterium]MBT5608517.1 hypothetical protein [Lentisphaerota bacterium]MBT7058525.1 hypothetical protein [Lentisphaerota bacterium]MBT7843234.1 hypothetical protein [Lentisphaerota bacterium]